MQLLNVKIVSPEQIVWEGRARSVSSVNPDGPFDVLPEHANFVTVIEKKPITIRTEDKKPVVFTFEQCVLYITSNKVSIYTTG
jgi:F0F1-type ATP synthase epsilon subunit